MSGGGLRPESSSSGSSFAKRARLVWGVFVPSLFLLGLAWFVWREGTPMLARLPQTPPGDALLIAALFALGHFLNSTEFWLLYAATGTRMGIVENWLLFTAGQLANHLPAQVGTLFRLRYMRLVHHVPYPRSAAIYGADLVITLASAAAIGLVGVAASAAVGAGGHSTTLVVVFGGTLAAAAVIAFLPLPPATSPTGRIARLWRQFHAGVDELRERPGTAVAVALLETAKYTVTAWRIQVTFALIGVEAPYPVFLVLAPAAGIASFIAVTPAAVGFREAFVTGAAAAMGLTLSQGLMGATVDRAVMLLTFLVLGGIGLLVTYPRYQAATLARGGDPAAPDEAGARS